MCPRTPVYSTGRQDACRYMHPPMAETRKVTKPSSQDTEQDKKPRQQAYRDACVLSQTTKRDKEKYYLWEEKDLQSMSTQPNPRVTESKKLTSPKFSPANLNLEKQKTHHSCFHWTLQAEIWETDVVRTLTSRWLLSEVQDLSATAVQE